MGRSAVGRSACARNICAAAKDQCPQNFPGLHRPVDGLSHVSGTLLFSPLLVPLSRHSCFSCGPLEAVAPSFRGPYARAQSEFQNTAP